MDIKPSYSINNQKKTIKTKRKEIITLFGLFNQPYSKSVKTNIGRIFIKLISKHFPPNHACMSNFRSKINGQNKKILQPQPAEPQKLCNCLVKVDCPLNGLCLTSSILYQATIKCSDSKYKQKRYKGICEKTFKKRYANHKNHST